MKKPAIRCTNLNHGRMNPPINFCPNCGEKLKSALTGRCDAEKHKTRLKERNFFCFDCGKNLRSAQ